MGTAQETETSLSRRCVLEAQEAGVGKPDSSTEGVSVFTQDLPSPASARPSVQLGAAARPSSFKPSGRALCQAAPLPVLVGDPSRQRARETVARDCERVQTVQRLKWSPITEGCPYQCTQGHGL